MCGIYRACVYVRIRWIRCVAWKIPRDPPSLPTYLPPRVSLDPARSSRGFASGAREKYSSDSVLPSLSRARARADPQGNVTVRENVSLEGLHRSQLTAAARARARAEAGEIFRGARDAARSRLAAITHDDIAPSRDTVVFMRNDVYRNCPSRARARARALRIERSKFPRRDPINYLLIISTCNLQYAGGPSIEKSRIAFSEGGAGFDRA